MRRRDRTAPGDVMRRSEREITDRGELRRVLEDARVCRLAMADGGRPYLVPLSFALDGDDLVLHSARAGRKLELLRRNPEVCFEFVEDRAERARLLALFGPRYGAPAGAIPDAEVDRTIVLRVRIRELTGKRSP